MDTNCEILTIAEVAATLRCSKAHIAKAIRGDLRHVTPLPAISMGRRKLIRRASLHQWLRDNEHRLAGGMLPASLDVGAVGARRS